mmetsp:Transcript_88788/g.248477  ORF Transcript_88788/g.248477 Transcript_88788/m.248477 type:complete len:290 (+) Transcript_88788:1094-1963(+)
MWPTKPSYKASREKGISVDINAWKPSSAAGALSTHLLRAFVYKLIRSRTSSSLSFWPNCRRMSTSCRRAGHFMAIFASASTAAPRTRAFSRMSLLYMKRMYLDGTLVLGTSSPRKAKILVHRVAYSQSSMNSHKCSNPASLAAGTWEITSSSASTMSLLKSALPSSRKCCARKDMSTLCLLGYCKHKPLTARTTSILKTSLMSDMKVVICFTSRSTLDSWPVFSSVVSASVAVLRLESDSSGSMSQLHRAATCGRTNANECSVLIAPKRMTGFADVRKIWRIVVACVMS